MNPKRLISFTVATLTAAASASACGTRPTDVAELQRACPSPPPGATYDWSYATVNPSGIVTGVARCASDGSVASWDPRPSGSGDEVRVYDRGQVGP